MKGFYKKTVEIYFVVKKCIKIGGDTMKKLIAGTLAFGMVIGAGSSFASAEETNNIPINAMGLWYTRN